eukprot:scaffold381_cov178-Amphora_coffeaeformis.AAC.11
MERKKTTAGRSGSDCPTTEILVARSARVRLTIFHILSHVCSCSQFYTSTVIDVLHHTTQQTIFLDEVGQWAFPLSPSQSLHLFGNIVFLMLRSRQRDTLLDDDSFRESPRRTRSKRTTPNTQQTLLTGDCRMTLVLGVAITVLLISYYSLATSVLEQTKSAGRDNNKPMPSKEAVPLPTNEVAPSHQIPDTKIAADAPVTVPRPIYNSNNKKSKATIAYLTSMTACPTNQRQHFFDAAAVLKHSIHLNSIRNPDSSSVYDYAMYVILHTEASHCAEAFRQIGYTVLLRDTPFELAEIQNEKYVQRLTNPNAGCCAEKEFLKLYSYTMHDYKVVVHLDMDFIVLKPMDTLFDSFFEPDEATKEIPHAMWPHERQWTGRIETMFTRDYPMGQPGRETVEVGMQGGFWILRPNQTAFDEMIALIRQGNFEGGWYDDRGPKKVKYPGFYGAAMIQGLVAFFYGHYHPGQAVELDRCVHNQMADDPTRGGKKSDKCFVSVDGVCRDCRKENVSDIYSAHFTFCFKPVRND